MKSFSEFLKENRIDETLIPHILIKRLQKVTLVYTESGEWVEFKKGNHDIKPKTYKGYDKADDAAARMPMNANIDAVPIDFLNESEQ